MVSHTQLPNGNFQVISRYLDPLTGKRKKATLTYGGSTTRAKRNAERELEDKIDRIINERMYGVEEQTKTFEDLKRKWFDVWRRGVSPRTVERELLVLRRIDGFMEKDYLIDKMSPIFIEKILADYQEKFNSSYSTMIHIKSTLNKIFKFAVKHGMLENTPMAVVELKMSREKRMAPKKRRQNKFLEPYEFNAFLSEIKKTMNLSYYYLTIFLVHSGVRIGEAGGITMEDIDFTKNIVNISKNLIVAPYGHYEYGPTKTEESERMVSLPKIAMEALKESIRLNKQLEKRYLKKPWKSYVASKSIFRTQNGSPITSRSFRGIISRVEKHLIDNCEDLYGFKWMKHVTPHSFRFINITYLKDSEGVDLKSIQSHVGHSDIKTTMGVYAQSSIKGDQKLVEAMEEWSKNSELEFNPKTYRNKYAGRMSDYLGTLDAEGEIYMNIDDFRKLMGLRDNYAPRHISGNILIKLQQALLRDYARFECASVYDESRKVKGYTISWERK